MSGESGRDEAACRSGRCGDGKYVVQRLGSGARRAFPQGLMVRERPVEGGGRGVSFHLAPSPYRAFGEAGRSQPRLRAQCATGDRPVEPQDVAAPPDKREDPCESPEAGIVNRPSTSISHSGVAVSGSAGASVTFSGSLLPSGASEDINGLLLYRFRSVPKRP